MKKTRVYLTLQNGKVFEGYRFGADGEALGELVFTTSAVGYLETLTDPSYYGQIVAQTFPMIGNYGVIESDFESKKPWLSAYVVREYCEDPSNFRMEGKLDDYLKKVGVVGIYGVDTRELTRIIREYGVMNACISSKPVALDKLSDYQIKNAVKAVAPENVTLLEAENAKYTVAFWDFGGKNSTVQELLSYGVNVVRLPASYTAEQILKENVDGIVLSDGPGDPMENQSVIAELKKLLGKKPIFGIGLGHQLVALALGGKTEKMKYGHRGGNQPVKHLESDRVYISSQNHGYVVITDSIKQGKVTFVNVNDGTCEGLECEELNVFTSQFAPSACSAACEPNILYNKFIANMKKEKDNA